MLTERVLCTNRRHRACSYANLNTESFSAQFIEQESVPRDATVVDHTWQYVNKKGGPDRRFNSSRDCIEVSIRQDLPLA